MKTKVTESKFRSALGRVGQFFSMVALGAAILTCSGASAQNLFVSGRDAGGGEIFQFTWDGGQSIFASGLYKPWDMAFDSAGNLFGVDYLIVGGDLPGNAAIYKITPNGTLTIFASRLSYASSLATDKAGNLFVADYDKGSIYRYKPDGSRVTIAVLNAGDRPADLALDSIGNLYMGDLGGKIYRYALSGVLRRYSRTTFGSVPNSAQSLAFDSAGNLFVVDAGGASGTGTAMPNAVYKFTQQGARSTFASVDSVGESFACVAFRPIPCCQ